MLKGKKFDAFTLGFERRFINRQKTFLSVDKNILSLLATSF